MTTTPNKGTNSPTSTEQPAEPVTPDLVARIQHHQSEVAVRLCVDGRTLSPVTVTTMALPEPSSDAAALIASSQQRYGTARAEVEATLLARIANPEHDRQPGRERRGGTA